MRGDKECQALAFAALVEGCHEGGFIFRSPADLDLEAEAPVETAERGRPDLDDVKGRVSNGSELLTRIGVEELTTL
jgi:hypothetical protein